jgi:membrane protein DedA with SNARE-associated domain
MLEPLTDLVTGTPWAYAIIFALAALDAVLPIVPSESTLITAGVVAGTGDLDLTLVIAVGAAGAFVGDNGSYWIGRGLNSRVTRFLFASEKGRRRRRLVERSFERRGGSLIIIGRFVPGGRTAVTVTAGATSYLYTRFAGFAIAAALAWSAYATLLGYAGGKAYEDEPLKALFLGFGLALAGAALIEIGRRWGPQVARAITNRSRTSPL